MELVFKGRFVLDRSNEPAFLEEFKVLCDKHKVDFDGIVDEYEIEYTNFEIIKEDGEAVLTAVESESKEDTDTDI